MQFKLDENLHEDCAELLRRQGHDVHSIFDEGLQGSDDGSIAEVCQRESRVLLTLDTDFANVLEFPPGDYSGIVLLRLSRQSRMAVLRVLERLVPLFESEAVDRRLWIVSESQVRIRL
jgi:predicted nuclease of predicted toxin-antitoxin system